MTWASAAGSSARSRSSVSTSSSKGRSWWAKAARVVARTRRITSRGLGSPPRLVRRITVLTKGPMSPSVPGRLRLATLRGHPQVVLARVAMQQRLQGGDERHEQRAAFSMAEAFGGLRKARRQRHLPPRRAEIVDGPSRRRRGELHHRQRIAKLLCANTRAAQRCPDATASAAASAQSPRTESRAAPRATPLPAEKAS